MKPTPTELLASSLKAKAVHLRRGDSTLLQELDCGNLNLTPDDVVSWCQQAKISPGHDAPPAAAGLWSIPPCHRKVGWKMTLC